MQAGGIRYYQLDPLAFSFNFPRLRGRDDSQRGDIGDLGSCQSLFGRALHRVQVAAASGLDHCRNRPFCQGGISHPNTTLLFKREALNRHLGHHHSAAQVDQYQSRVALLKHTSKRFLDLLEAGAQTPVIGPARRHDGHWFSSRHLQGQIADSLGEFFAMCNHDDSYHKAPRQFLR